nr:adenylate cyclase [uncultured bacterium]
MDDLLPDVYCFAGFVMEPKEGRLWFGSQTVRLTPKAFDILLLLLADHGRVVSRDTLLDEVWPDAYVAEATLAQNIATIRKTLGSYAGERFAIETVPKRGFRVVTKVREISGPEAAALVASKMDSSSDPLGDDSAIYEGSYVPDQAVMTRRTGSWRRPQNLALAATLLVVTGIIAFLGWRGPRVPLSHSTFREVDVSQLAADGNVSLVNISPDGKYVCMVQKAADGYSSIIAKQINESAAINVLPPEQRRIVGVTFSRDSSRIFFTSYEGMSGEGVLIGKLYSVSLFGGPINEIVSDVDSPIAFSPTGEQIAFVRNSPAEHRSSVVVTDLRDMQERVLAVRESPENFDTTGLSWSPDKQTIVTTASEKNGNMAVVGINTQTGEQQIINGEDWKWVGFPNWLKDGSGIVVGAFSNKTGNQTDELWQLPFPSGVPRKIADGFNGVLGVSLSGDSDKVVAVKSERLAGFWVADLPNISAATRITQNAGQLNLNPLGINWIDDHKFLYTASLNGNLDIWVSDSDGTPSRQVTSDPSAEYSPVPLADGKRFVYVSTRSGKPNIWITNLDGTGPRQLTNENQVASPSLSVDGEQVYYSSPDGPDNSTPVLRRISLDGGESEKLTSAMTLLPQISPDGKLVACFFQDPKRPMGPQLTVLSALDGALVKQWPVWLQQDQPPVRWADTQTLTYLQHGESSSTLYSQKLSSSSPEILIDTPHERIYRLSWSRESGRLIYEKGNTVNKVVLLRSI